MLWYKSLAKYNRKRNYLLILMICVVTSVGIINNINYTNYANNINYKTFGACYYDESDSLPSAEDALFSPGTNSIFFHETSCRGGLIPRQACIIESAARKHPDRQVYVMFSAPVTEQSIKEGDLRKLLELPNVKFARVHITKYAKNTPLESLIVSKQFLRSQYWMEHTCDLLRYMTLYKFGGLYLDTDMLVTKSLTPLGGTWIAREDIYNVNGAALAISVDPVGRKFINLLINHVNSSYRADEFLHNGPYALVRVLNKFCTSSKPLEWSSETCQGLYVYGPQFIYPIHYSCCNDYFEPGKLVRDISEAFTHHLWNKLTFNVTIKCGSPLAAMLPTLCPAIYQMYNKDFEAKCKLPNVSAHLSRI